jgi:5-dehydro-4-deoxyglucarate dehydratase
LSFPLTPFTAGGEVDLDVFAEHVDAQIAARPAGVFVACGTGEYPALDLDEYAGLARTAVSVAAGRVPVFSGAGGGTRMASAFAGAAAEAGVSGLLLLPPYLVGAPPHGLVRHIAAVAAATPLPIAVYQRANAVLSPAAAVELLDIPTVVGIKDGRGDVEAMYRIVTAIRSSGHPRAAEFGFLNGLPTAEMSVRAYRAIGVDSYSSAVLCFAPEIATRFYRAVTEGDEAAQDALVAKFYLPLVQLRDTTEGYAVALVKAGARLRGLKVGGVRPPLIDPTPEHEAALGRIIEDGLATVAELG